MNDDNYDTENDNMMRVQGSNTWGEQEYTDGLVQERRNSIANALELCLSSTKPSTCISTA